MAGRLSDKVCIVTGGAKGLGRVFVSALLAEGARIAALDVASAEPVPGALHLTCDVTDADACRAAVAQVVEELGTVDVLINNAGQLVDHDFRAGSPDPDAADAAIYANLNAPIRLIVALMATLRARPEAAIVNVTSGLAIAPAARTPVYCATKTGLRFYTLALRAQLEGTNIHVIEALPPVVDTQMNEGNDMKKMSAEECARQIVVAIEKNKAEANIGLTKALRVVEGISPSLAKGITLKF